MVFPSCYAGVPVILGWCVGYVCDGIPTMLGRCLGHVLMVPWLFCDGTPIMGYDGIYLTIRIFSWANFFSRCIIAFFLSFSLYFYVIFKRINTSRWCSKFRFAVDIENNNEKYIQRYLQKMSSRTVPPRASSVGEICQYLIILKLNKRLI